MVFALSAERAGRWKRKEPAKQKKAVRSFSFFLLF
jgi:hypothetical protein